MPENELDAAIDIGLQSGYGDEWVQIDWYPVREDDLEGYGVYRSRTGGNDWEPLTNGLPQSDCYVNVLRDAMTVDTLDPCGIYFGTTGGQVYVSNSGGDRWEPARPFQLPA